MSKPKASKDTAESAGSPVVDAAPAPAAPEFNPSKAETAYKELLLRYAAIPDADLLPMNIDVQAAAIVGLAVAARIAAPAFRARFQSLPDTEFKIAHVNDLEKMAWGAWYAANEYERVQATSSSAKLPAELVERATTIEARMQACCEYYFSDDVIIAPELARLRPGTGHRDLANDLKGYAAIYRDQLAVVENDRKHYRATDLADAGTAADEILIALGDAQSPEERATQDLAARGWTLFFTTYKDVEETGLWLERNTKNGRKLFPSLHAAAKASVPRKKKVAPKTQVPPSTGQKIKALIDKTGAAFTPGKTPGA